MVAMNKYYSIEAEVNRVSNNIKNLTDLIDEYGLPKKPMYLVEEISFLERELEFLKEERVKRYKNETVYHEMAFTST